MNVGNLFGLFALIVFIEATASGIFKRYEDMSARVAGVCLAVVGVVMLLPPHGDIASALLLGFLAMLHMEPDIKMDTPKYKEFITALDTDKHFENQAMTMTGLICGVVCLIRVLVFFPVREDILPAFVMISYTGIALLITTAKLYLSYRKQRNK